jgi:hypothetical protein
VLLVMWSCGVEYKSCLSFGRKVLGVTGVVLSGVSGVVLEVSCAQ